MKVLDFGLAKAVQSAMGDNVCGSRRIRRCSDLRFIQEISVWPTPGLVVCCQSGKLGAEKNRRLFSENCSSRVERQEQHARNRRPEKPQFSVTDFLSWKREGTLDLKPRFQRRSVWKPGAKSFFIDTVVRGLPAPIIYLRQKLDLNSQVTVREVVDGQQRLRTLFAYIDSNTLEDYDRVRDGFEVKKIHNPDLAGKSFRKLLAQHRERILSYGTKHPRLTH